MSMRELGDQLEKHVLETWPEESPIYMEPASGSVNNQNDLFTSEFSIECKRRLKSATVSIAGGVIRKARIKANRQQKDPLWIVESTEGTFVICPYDNFCELVAEAHGQEEES